MENEKSEILIKKFSFLKVPFNREVRLVILTQKIRLVSKKNLFYAHFSSMMVFSILRFGQTAVKHSN